MQPLRVARISHSVLPRIGGQELHIHRLGIHLARMGVEQRLFYLWGGPPAEHNIRCHRIPPPPWPRGSHMADGLWLGKGVWTRLKAMASLGWRPHIVHSHGDATDALVGGVLARAIGARAVHTVHGGLPQRLSYGPWARICFSLSERIIAVSPRLVSQLREWGVDQAKCVVMSSGVDMEALGRVTVEEGWALGARWGLKPGDEIVLCVGRLSPVKGQRYLLEAGQILSALRPRLRLVFVGGGKLEKPLKALARGQQWAVFTGELAPAQVYKLYKIAKVSVLPSVELFSQHEGTPTALMEAMAAKVPVVATKTGGIQELIADHQDGILVAPRDPMQLAEAINRFLTDPSFSQRVGTKAYKKIVKRDWKIVAQRIADLYRELARNL